MSCKSIHSDYEIIAATGAMKVAELAKAWNATPVKSEVGCCNASFVVHAETKDGRHIREVISSNPETILVDLEIKSDQKIVKQASCPIEDLGEFTRRFSFPSSSQADQFTVYDTEALDWNDDSSELQPRSPMIELLRSLG